MLVKIDPDITVYNNLPALLFLMDFPSQLICVPLLYFSLEPSNNDTIYLFVQFANFGYFRTKVLLNCPCESPFYREGTEQRNDLGTETSM